MLKLRLKELENVVDHYILCESNMTFSGLEKPLYFEERNISHPKLTHIVYNQTSSFCSPWKREMEQRDFLQTGLSKLDFNLEKDDIIILSDLDEIPDSDTLQKIKIKGLPTTDIYSLNQDMYYYNLECKLERRWCWPKVFTYDTLLKSNKKFSEIRITSPYPIIKDKGGWHLSYFGDVEYIVNKIKSFSHQEFNNDKYLNKQQIEKLIKENKDILLGGSGIVRFRHIPIDQNKYLPKNYLIINEPHN